MEGSRFEWLEVSRFGCCHQPWRVTRSLGLKNPSGYRLFGVSRRTYNIQHSVWGVKCAQWLRGEGVSRHEPGVLQDSVALSDATSRSGVTHLESSVLHCFVVAVPGDAGLSGAAPILKGGGESMATRFSEPSRFRASPSVIGVGRAGVLNVVRAGPKALGVSSPLARIVLGVGGFRAGS